MSARLGLTGVARAPWRVRAMRAHDLDEVMRIEREVYAFPWTRGNFADSLSSGYDAWVLESTSAMIGYAVSMWTLDEIHLLNLSVDRRWQGQGVGRWLLEWACRDATSRGAIGMFLEVRPSNDRARQLYASCGFERIGVRRRYYPSYNDTREDAWVLRARLPLAERPISAGGPQ